MSRTVVITGLGPVTAFGLGMDPLFEALLAGRSGIRRIERFDPAGFPCQIGAELPDDLFSVRKVVPKSYRKAVKVMCRDIELAVGAASAAIEDAQLVTKATDPNGEPTIPGERFGCHIGAGLIVADVNELAAALMTSRTDAGQFDIRHWGASGMENLTPLWLLKYLPNMLACHVTIIHDCRGPSNTITCCEASGGLSLGESMRVIERGAADACLTGGAEFKLNPMAMVRQHFAGRLAEVNGNTSDPASVVRPFDRQARGTVLGEGGGILVLEAKEIAEARGAEPYAVVAGFASSQTAGPAATSLESPEAGQDLANAISGAMRQAGVGPDEIDAIVPFGSSIPESDRSEAAAINRVFGDKSASIPLITTVPNAGNCGAGNGGVGLCVAARCLRDQKLPARINTTEAAGLDANKCAARDAALGTILVCTSSQGGQNAAIILRKP